MSLFSKNPELKRNLLIEFSPFRLVIMPVVLLVIFFGVSLVSDGKSEVVYFTAATFFYLIVFIWGTKLAADSIIGEFNEGTWDSQKMTLLSPWKMIMGKLLGSTGYAWYGGAICLLTALVFAFFTDNPLKYIPGLISLPIYALTIHSFAIMIALSLITQNKNKRKLNSSIAFIIPLVIGFGLIQILNEFYRSYFAADLITSYTFYPLNLNQSWWFVKINSAIFSFFTTALFAFWSIIGAYTFLRKEFSYKNSPKYFLWFIISMCVYYCGITVVMFDNGPLQKVLMILATIFVILGLITYFCIFYESKDPMALNKSVQSWTLLNLIKNFASIPRWVLSAMLTTSAGIILVLFLIVNSSWAMNILTYLKEWGKSDVPYALIFAILGLILLMIRDISIVLSLNFAKKTKSPGFAAVLYILMFYSIMPLIAHYLHNGAEAAFLPLFFLKNESLPGNIILLVLIAVQTFVFLRIAVGKYSESISFIINDK